MRISWLTDIHLNFLRTANGAEQFIKYVKLETECDAIVVTGDISEAPTLEEHLKQMLAPGIPIYFIVGNHDFYGGSFGGVYKLLDDKFKDKGWLGAPGVIAPLTRNTVLVGQDGWYDATAADPMESKLFMSDWALISDFRGMGKQRLVEKCRFLAQREAGLAKDKLMRAAQTGDNVIFATHYPPFVGACWHEGGISDKHYLPWFTNLIMGDVLMEVAYEFPNVQFTVLCGHTHSGGIYKAAENLVVKTGPSLYGRPDIAGFFDVK